MQASGSSATVLHARRLLVADEACCRVADLFQVKSGIGFTRPATSESMVFAGTVPRLVFEACTLLGEHDAKGVHDDRAHQKTEPLPTLFVSAGFVQHGCGARPAPRCL